MDFSIIINTHDQSKFLNECIKSCLNQNYSSYEIIVVDTSKRPSKDKYKNLIVYAVVNNILNSHKINAPKLLSNHIKNNMIERNSDILKISNGNSFVIN